MVLSDDLSTVDTQAKDVWTHTEGFKGRWVRVIKPN